MQQAVAAAGQLRELLAALLDEAKDRLVEIVAPGHHAVHVVLLVLHRANQHRVFQIHHRRHTATGWSEQFTLGLGGAVDRVVRRAEELAQQLGFRGAIGPLRVGGEHAVLDVHARVERQLVDLAQDDCRIRRVLGVASHHHRPTDVECAVKIVVTAMHVERLLGQRASADLHHHGGELARRVIILLHRVGDALPGGEVDRTLAGHGERRGTALGGVFAFALDRDL